MQAMWRKRQNSCVNANTWLRQNTRNGATIKLLRSYIGNCKTYDLEHAGNWYDHSPQMMFENEKVKILWDMRIQTDKVMEHFRQDIVVLEKESSHCNIIDVKCHFHTHVVEKEKEEVDKYQDLKR